MNIVEAMNARDRYHPFIARKVWLSVVSNSPETAPCIQPTDTPEGCLFYGLTQKIPAAGWQPRAEDLLAEDWIPTTRF